ILPQEEIKKEQNRLMKKIFLWKRKRNIPSGIIGIVTLYGDSSEDEDILPGEFDIGITVDESFQKRGIGRQLLRFIITRGKEVKYERATLWTRIDNQPMIKLARKMGFQKGKKRERDGYVWFQYFLDVKEKEKKEEEKISS
ncbi:MAG: GNAT family N-acetyltransferase, partial [Candidatus Heimdallarchaeota archaeon]